jgi:outer membrane protein assembly factor BamE (lipoprotein component of BamABCDE complex)
MRYRNLLSFCLCLTIFCLTSCSFYCGMNPYYAEGKKFKYKNVSQLVKGSSTRNDVLRLFGEPLARSTDDPQKAKWWRYRYAYLGFLGIETGELEVSFEGDIVEDYQAQVTRNRY